MGQQATNLNAGQILPLCWQCHRCVIDHMPAFVRSTGETEVHCTSSGQATCLQRIARQSSSRITRRAISHLKCSPSSSNSMLQAAPITLLGCIYLNWLVIIGQCRIRSTMLPRMHLHNRHEFLSVKGLLSWAWHRRWKEANGSWAGMTADLKHGRSSS